MRVEDIIITNLDVFNDNDEHEVIMNFRDGHADLEVSEDVCKEFHLVYPTLKEVKGDQRLFYEVRDYIGIPITPKELNVHDIALTFGEVKLGKFNS